MQPAAFTKAAGIDNDSSWAAWLPGLLLDSSAKVRRDDWPSLGYETLVLLAAPCIPNGDLVGMIDA